MYYGNGEKSECLCFESWLVHLIVPFLIGQSDYFGFGFTHLIVNCQNAKFVKTVQLSS